MAQRVLIELVDDLDGSEAVETVLFGFDGRQYEIDLNKKNADRLRKALDPYLGPARRVGGTSKPKRNNSDAKLIREWAKSAGYEVPDRGRIPENVREAYVHATAKKG